VITIAAIAMGVIIAVCGYRWGFYTIWAVLFNIMISIYLSVMLSPTVAAFAPMLFGGYKPGDAGFWYVYAAVAAAVALASFIVLQVVAMTYFTGTFNITLPRLLENLGAIFIGFVTGYILWGFICFLVLILPISKDQPVLLKAFTADEQSKELSVPVISKVVNTINALSLQPNGGEVKNVINWTLGWDVKEPNGTK